MFLAEPQHAAVAAPEILIVGGGKGGVGKTCFSANLAIEVARKGWRVIVVDADLGCSNLDLVLGVRPQHRLDDFFNHPGRKQLEPYLCDTPYENLRIVPGASGALDIANPRYQQKVSLIRELQRLDADLVIIDLDAGTHLNTLDFFLIAETNGVLVITPEKTSIDNAYKFIRSAVFRKIERFYRSGEVSRLLNRHDSLRSFLNAFQESAVFEDSLKQQLVQEMLGLARGIRPKIVVNRARNHYEAEIAANYLAKNARQKLLVEPQKIGYILFDTVVPEAVNSGIPYVVSHPDRKISGCIATIASHLGYV
jgi:flagellar biosynthesis protein FlhG